MLNIVNTLFCLSSFWLSYFETWILAKGFRNVLLISLPRWSAPTILAASEPLYDRCGWDGTVREECTRGPSETELRTHQWNQKQRRLPAGRRNLNWGSPMAAPLALPWFPNEGPQRKRRGREKVRRRGGGGGNREAKARKGSSGWGLNTQTPDQPLFLGNFDLLPSTPLMTTQ